MNRKYVQTDSSVLHQKALSLSLYKDFSKGAPETSDTSHLLHIRDGYTDLRTGLD